MRTPKSWPLQVGALMGTAPAPKAQSAALRKPGRAEDPVDVALQVGVANRSAFWFSQQIAHLNSARRLAAVFATNCTFCVMRSRTIAESITASASPADPLSMLLHASPAVGLHCHGAFLVPVPGVFHSVRLCATSSKHTHAMQSNDQFSHTQGLKGGQTLRIYDTSARRHKDRLPDGP